MSLGPNEMEPCGTRSARLRHAALAQLCAVCNPRDAEFTRQGRCPDCGMPVTVYGDRYDEHTRTVVTGAGRSERPCPGSNGYARPSNTLAAAVRRRREQLGLTQAEAAVRAGVPQPTLGSIEAGVSGGTGATLIALSRGLDADWVLAPRVPA